MTPKDSSETACPDDFLVDDNSWHSHVIYPALSREEGDVVPATSASDLCKQPWQRIVKWIVLAHRRTSVVMQASANVFVWVTVLQAAKQSEVQATVFQVCGVVDPSPKSERKLLWTVNNHHLERWLETLRGTTTAAVPCRLETCEWLRGVPWWTSSDHVSLACL